MGPWGVGALVGARNLSRPMSALVQFGNALQGYIYIKDYGRWVDELHKLPWFEAVAWLRDWAEAHDDENLRAVLGFLRDAEPKPPLKQTTLDTWLVPKRAGAGAGAASHGQ